VQQAWCNHPPVPMLYETTRLSAPGQIGARRQSRIERVYAWEHQPVGRRPLVSTCPLLQGGPNKAPSQKSSSTAARAILPPGQTGVWDHAGNGCMLRRAAPRRSVQISLRSPRSTRKPPSLHWRKGDVAMSAGRTAAAAVAAIAVGRPSRSGASVGPCLLSPGLSWWSGR
jgi:hypothetical protein